MGKTLVRAAIGFVIAMALGTALGIALGACAGPDRLFSTWVVVGLNLPAIVIAIALYIWLGLTEFALILAVVLNKVPLVITTIREGVRSFSPDYDDLGRAFRLPFGRRLRLIYVPQLMPFVLAAARTGLSLIWKIVLVFEVLGSDGGVGFRISLFFQFFDIKGILAYTTAFIARGLRARIPGPRARSRRSAGWSMAHDRSWLDCDRPAWRFAGAPPLLLRISRSTVRPGSGAGAGRPVGRRQIHPAAHDRPGIDRGFAGPGHWSTARPPPRPRRPASCSRTPASCPG